MDSRTWSGGTARAREAGDEWAGGSKILGTKVRRRQRRSLYDNVVSARTARAIAGRSVGAATSASIGGLDSLDYGNNEMKRGSVSSIAGLLPAAASRSVEVVKKRGDSDFGFMLTGDRPAIFSSIVHKSPAARAGLRVGDVLLEINGHSMESASHSDIVLGISKCKKTIVVAVIDDETYRLGMSLVGYTGPTGDPPVSANPNAHDADGLPARSISTTSSLASRSSLASHSDNESGRSPSLTFRAVSSSPTASIQSGRSEAPASPSATSSNAQPATGSQSSLASTRSEAQSLRSIFPDTEETRYDGKRRSTSQQKVNQREQQRNRAATISSGLARSSLAKSKSFSQSEGSIMHSVRSSARPANVAFALTEDVVVSSPPTETTHSVAGGSQLEHYDFTSLYFGDVVLARESQPGALTGMAADAVRVVSSGGSESHPLHQPKHVVMQISSSGVCLVEKLGDKRRTSVGGDPVFIPRANLCAAWYNPQPPHFLTLLQRANPWSVPPSSPLHKRVVEQQQQEQRSQSQTSNSRMSSDSNGTADGGGAESAAATSSSSSPSPATGSGGSSAVTTSSRHLVIVNAHVLQVDSRHASPVHSQHHSHSQPHSRGSSTAARSKSPLLTVNGHEVGRVAERKSSSPEHLQQAQNVVALLSSLFRGTEENLAASQPLDSESDRTTPSSQNSADGDSTLTEDFHTTISSINKDARSSSSEHLPRLVDSQGTLSFRGLDALTSRPSHSVADGFGGVGGSSTLGRNSSSRSSTGGGFGDGRSRVDIPVRPAVRFDWDATRQITTRTDGDQSLPGHEKEDEGERRRLHASGQNDVIHGLTAVKDLADEKFSELNLSSSSLANRTLSDSGTAMKKSSMDDLRVNGGSHTGGRVAGWAMNIMTLLTDDAGLRLFRKYLQGVYAEENLDFWLAVSRHQKLTDEEEIAHSAEKIVQMFVVSSSEKQVNLDHIIVKRIEAALEEPNVTMFDRAQADILKLMKSDSHSKFVRTDEFKELMKAEMSNLPLPWDTAPEKKKKRDRWWRGKAKAGRGESMTVRPLSVTTDDIDPAEKIRHSLEPERTVMQSTSVSRLDQSPMTSPFHAGISKGRVDTHSLSPSGSEASLAMTMSLPSNSSPAISKKDRERRSNNRFTSIFKSKDKHPDIRINPPHGTLMKSGGEDHSLEANEVLLRITIIDTCGVVKRKKNISIRNAIEASCTRASLDRDSVAVFECIGGVQRPVDILMQVGSLQSTILHVTPLSTIRFLMPNGKVESVCLKVRDTPMSDIVDRVLNEYGLCMHDAIVKDKHGKMVHPFTVAGKYTDQQIVLDFDRSYMEGRARRNSGDSSTMSVSSMQIGTAEKSPSRRRSRSFRKPSPSPFSIHRRSRHGSPLSDERGSGSLTRLSQVSGLSLSPEEKRRQTAGAATSGSMETLSDVHTLGVDEQLVHAASPEASVSIGSQEAALFDLVEKAQSESLVGQRATLHVASKHSDSSLTVPRVASPDPGYTPPIAHAGSSFPFAGKKSSTAPRGAVADFLKENQHDPEDLLLHRRMSASPQTYRYRQTNAASGFRGSSSSLSQLSQTPEHHASTQSLTATPKATPRRLMKSFSRSLSKLSQSNSDLRAASAQSDVPINSSMLAGMLKDGDIPPGSTEATPRKEGLLSTRGRSSTLPHRANQSPLEMFDTPAVSLLHRSSDPSPNVSAIAGPAADWRGSDTLVAVGLDNGEDTAVARKEAEVQGLVTASPEKERVSRPELSSSSSSEEELERPLKFRTGPRTLVHDV